MHDFWLCWHLRSVFLINEWDFAVKEELFDALFHNAKTFLSSPCLKLVTRLLKTLFCLLKHSPPTYKSWQHSLPCTLIITLSRKDLYDNYQQQINQSTSRHYWGSFSSHFTELASNFWSSPNAAARTRTFPNQHLPF